MFEIVPVEYYKIAYIYGSFIIVLITLLHTAILSRNNQKNLNYINFIGYVILVVITFFIGLRPINGFYFVDMRTYAQIYESYEQGGRIMPNTDIVFQLFMKFCASFLSVNSFFLICAILYIVPLYIASKRLFLKYWFYAFFMLIISMSFWSYGVNGIRNGIATSFFILGISFYKRKQTLITFFILSVLFHKSMLLPVIAYFITKVYNNSKWYFKSWLIAIPLSILFGGVWEQLFASLGFGDDRFSGYLLGAKDKLITKTGFRYDFLLYSASAVLTGWYFIFKRKFNDPFYIQLFNIFLISNAFWILIIRANFSNRFAYLSWFMMGIIIIYPFIVKRTFFKKPNFVIGKVISIYFLFTYIMFLYYQNIR